MLLVAEFHGIADIPSLRSENQEREFAADNGNKSFELEVAIVAGG